MSCMRERATKWAGGMNAYDAQGCAATLWLQGQQPRGTEHHAIMRASSRTVLCAALRIISVRYVLSPPKAP